MFLAPTQDFFFLEGNETCDRKKKWLPGATRRVECKGGVHTYSIDAIQLLGGVEQDRGKQLPPDAVVAQELPGLLGFNSQGGDPLLLHVLHLFVIVVSAVELSQGWVGAGHVTVHFNSRQLAVALT